MLPPRFIHRLPVLQASVAIPTFNSVSLPEKIKASFCDLRGSGTNSSRRPTIIKCLKTQELLSHVRVYSVEAWEHSFESFLNKKTGFITVRDHTDSLTKYNLKFSAFETFVTSRPQNVTLSQNFATTSRRLRNALLHTNTYATSKMHGPTL